METNNSKIIIGALLVLSIGLGIGYNYGAGQVRAPQAGTHMMPGGEMMKDGMMGGVADQHFIVEMIPHHQGAIAMANVALEKSKQPKILKLANEIIVAQSKEINDMTVWYKNWYDADVPSGGMGMHMGGMTGDLTTLKAKSGEDFDREFLTQMIPHHEMAIMMAQMIRSSERPEMRQLAENIVTSQAQEIQMMRGWLVSGFGG
jgi:uncharacterized protein (DUF305 family)